MVKSWISRKVLGSSKTTTIVRLEKKKEACRINIVLWLGGTTH